MPYSHLWIKWGAKVHSLDRKNNSFFLFLRSFFSIFFFIFVTVCEMKWMDCCMNDWMSSSLCHYIQLFSFLFFHCFFHHWQNQFWAAPFNSSNKKKTIIKMHTHKYKVFFFAAAVLKLMIAHLLLLLFIIIIPHDHDVDVTPIWFHHIHFGIEIVKIAIISRIIIIIGMIIFTLKKQYSFFEFLGAIFLPYWWCLLAKKK